MHLCFSVLRFDQGQFIKFQQERNFIVSLCHAQIEYGLALTLISKEIHGPVVGM